MNATETRALYRRCVEVIAKLHGKAPEALVEAAGRGSLVATRTMLDGYLERQGLPKTTASWQALEKKAAAKMASDKHAAWESHPGLIDKAAIAHAKLAQLGMSNIQDVLYEIGQATGDPGINSVAQELSDAVQAAMTYLGNVAKHR